MRVLWFLGDKINALGELTPYRDSTSKPTYDNAMIYESSTVSFAILLTSLVPHSYQMSKMDTLLAPLVSKG